MKNDRFQVDKEFMQHMHRLKPDEQSQLENNLLRDGCRDALVVWKEEGLLLDGHNRLQICKQHSIPYDIKAISLPNRKAALMWILETQLGRRNCSRFEKAELALKLKPEIAKKAKENERVRKGNQAGASFPDLGNLNKTINTEKELAKKAGIGHGTIAKVEYLTKAGGESIIEKLRSGESSIDKEYTELRRKEKEQERQARRDENVEQIATAPDVDAAVASGARFATIAIDPPWDWDDEGDQDQLGRARPTYGTMSLEELMELPLGDLADEDCHLYLWITNRSLPKGFVLLERWGFRYVTALTWCKPSFGMGNYFRGSTEHILFGVKGSQPLKRKDMGTWFQAPRGPLGHSSKPVEFYDLVESCSPGPYLEMFARSKRVGWSAWGADVNGN